MRRRLRHHLQATNGFDPPSLVVWMRHHKHMLQPLGNQHVDQAFEMIPRGRNTRGDDFMGLHDLSSGRARDSVSGFTLTSASAPLDPSPPRQPAQGTGGERRAISIYATREDRSDSADSRDIDTQFSRRGRTPRVLRQLPQRIGNSNQSTAAPSFREGRSMGCSRRSGHARFTPGGLDASLHGAPRVTQWGRLKPGLNPSNSQLAHPQIASLQEGRRSPHGVRPPFKSSQRRRKGRQLWNLPRRNRSIPIKHFPLFHK